MMNNLEIIECPFIQSPHLSYKVFQNIPPELLITEDTPVGTTVYAADFPKSLKLRFRKYHKPASPGFPAGGFTLWNPKLQVIYSCYFGGAMIHPDNKKKKRKKTPSRKVDALFE